MDAIDTLKAEIESAALDTAEKIDDFRIRYLSRKQGRITALL